MRIKILNEIPNSENLVLKISVYSCSFAVQITSNQTVSLMNFPEQTAISIEGFPSSFRAWFKSAIISWLVLCILLSGFALIVSGGMDPMNWLFLIGMSSVIHMGAYSLIGIPFFAFFWPQSHSCVWKIQFSLPIGALLGFLGMWLSFSILEGRPINLFDLEFAVDCIYGVAYGAVTAIVALKLKSHNNK